MKLAGKQIVVLFLSCFFCAIILNCCQPKENFSREFVQIEVLRDTLSKKLNWLNELDKQILLDRKNAIENDLFFLETGIKDTLPLEVIETVRKYKDLERIYKHIVKKVKWLEVETEGSFSQLLTLKEDMIANKAAAVSSEHKLYKEGLTMLQKNRIHLQDEIEIGNSFVKVYSDLRNKIIIADYAYLNLSIEVRNFINNYKSNVKNN